MNRELGSRKIKRIQSNNEARATGCQLTGIAELKRLAEEKSRFRETGFHEIRFKTDYNILKQRHLPVEAPHSRDQFT